MHPDSAGTGGAFFLAACTGKALLDEGESGKAVQELRKGVGHLVALPLEEVLKRNDECSASIACSWYGDALHLVGDNDGAEAAYQRALDLDADCVAALMSYANFVHRVRRDIERAAQVYRRGAAVDPPSGMLMSKYATFLKMARGDTSGAQAAHERAMEISPETPEVLGSAAAFYHGTRLDLERACDLYQKTLKHDPFSVNSLSNYGLFLAEVREDTNAAEKAYLRALELDPTHANAAYNYAVLLDSARKDKVGAEKWYRESIRRQPTHSFALYNLAVLLQEQRPTEAADEIEDLLRRAVQANPKDALTQVDFASYLARRAALLSAAPPGTPLPSLATGGSPAVIREPSRPRKMFVDSLKAFRTGISLREREGGNCAPVFVNLGNACLDLVELLLHMSSAPPSDIELRRCKKYIVDGTQAFMAASELCDEAKATGRHSFDLHHKKKTTPVAEVESAVLRGTARIAMLEDRVPEAEALLSKAARQRSGLQESLLLLGRFVATGGHTSDESRQLTQKLLLRTAQQPARPSDSNLQKRLSVLDLR